MILRSLRAMMTALAIQPASRAAASREVLVEECHIPWREEADARYLAMDHSELKVRYSGPKIGVDEQMEFLSRALPRLRNSALLGTEFEEFVEARTK